MSEIEKGKPDNEILEAIEKKLDSKCTKCVRLVEDDECLLCEYEHIKTNIPSAVEKKCIKAKIEVLEKVRKFALEKARKEESSSGDYYPDVNYPHAIKVERDSLTAQIKELDKCKV